MRTRTIQRKQQKLIVPPGVPKPVSSEIPFIRTLPDGTTKVTTVDRGKEIGALASHFLAAGGRYLVMKMPDETVEMVAVLSNGDEEPTAVACETTEDGPPMLDAIDRLVRDSVQRVGRLQ